MSIPSGGEMDFSYNLWKIAGLISIDVALMALVIKFALFAAFAHWRSDLSVSSTKAHKSRWRMC